MAGENAERAEKLNKLYLAIILRYKDIIEERERLSVSELPNLITPKDERVVEKAEEIKKNFPNYVYERDFYYASKMAFEFVKDGIEEIMHPVQFWMKPSETINFQIGDIMDKNILLCSLLIELGNPSAKVLVGVDDMLSAFTYYEFNGKLYLLDIKNSIKEFDSKDDIYKIVAKGDNTTAYEFNNQMYRDIS